MAGLDDNVALVAARLSDLARQAGGRRIIAAIAGPPGSGKSTLAEAVAARLNAGSAAGGGPAAVLPMDGYHFDDAILEARGDRPRKGAPHTFDADGFGAMLRRLRNEPGRPVAVPVFDRALELSRGSARLIGPEHGIVVAEGNYLLLDAEPWRALAPLFDLTVMIREPEARLLERLTARWHHFGLTGDALDHKLNGNDLPNARLVLASSRPADMTLGG